MTEAPTEQDIAEPFKAMEPIKDTRVAPAHGIAAIALSMAVKYHDIATVQDGALYQQYKLEGKNMTPLHLDMVFETAIRMERHLIGSSDRIAQMLVDAIEIAVEDEPKSDTENQPETKPA